LIQSIYPKLDSERERARVVSWDCIEKKIAKERVKDCEQRHMYYKSIKKKACYAREMNGTRTALWTTREWEDACSSFFN
jgi:hypothetical protein